MQIEYYSWMMPHIPRVANVPGLEEWSLPSFAEGRIPERLAAQMATLPKHSKLPSADTAWEWDDRDDPLKFVRACPDMLYRAGTFWLIRARFELNPGFSAWKRYNLDDFDRVWVEHNHPAWRRFTREDFADYFGENWPSDAASQDERIASLQDNPLRFLGIPGPLSLAKIVRSLEKPRFAKIYANERQAAGFLWAEGYPLPDGLDPAKCGPEGSGWTGLAQIGALVRLKMLPQSGVDIIQREDDAALDLLPLLQPAATNSPAGSDPPDRIGSTPGPPEGLPDPDAIGLAASGSKSRPPGDPAARAVAAAYELQKLGKPISIRAVCRKAGVDRNNLSENHPETVKLIEQLAEPDRTPRRGVVDRRTENLDAWDDPEDD